MTEHVQFKYWRDSLIRQAQLYSTLGNLSIEQYLPGTLHPLLLHVSLTNRDVTQQAVKLKMVSGILTYLLQSTRAAFKPFGSRSNLSTVWT